MIGLENQFVLVFREWSFYTGFTVQNEGSSLNNNSFLPSTIREWNTLGNTVQSCPSVSSFKKNMSTRQPAPNYYLTGSRNEQILHARIRTNCSSLHYTLFSKNIIQDKFCTCGEIEDVQHFLFSCQRQIMLEKVQRHCVPTLNVLLYGERSLNSNTNCIIFKAVQEFITHSKRFEN